MATLGQNAGLLEKHLGIIFPNQKTYVNARKQSDLRHPVTGNFLELDFWIPENHIAFEFQDSHHYALTWYSHSSKGNVQQQDNIKKIVTHKHRITLVVVPCWWDGSIGSLEESIRFERPDLFTSDHSCYNLIPLNPPFHFFPSQEIPIVGSLMLASFAADLHFNLFQDNISFWWMGEKYDGIRCCWNPLNRELYTRTGNELNLIPHVRKNFPPVFLDTELWFGRQNFGATCNIFKGSLDSVIWDFLRMVSFDVPSISMRGEAFELRYEYLLLNISNHHPFLVPAQRMACTSERQLAQLVEEIIDNKGEGVILRESGSHYIPGRSSSLIKLKSMQGDQEAMVVHVDDAIVRLKLTSGQVISIPHQDVFVQDLKQGDVVTFSYEGNARRDLPVNPKIVRIRSDVLWPDVLVNATKDKHYINERLTSSVVFTSQPLRHWTAKNMRLFLEEYAKNRRMDPLAPSTWSKITSNDIRQAKGGGVVLDKFKGSYFHMLQTLFPEIGLNENAFNIRARWQDIRARRNFFENYAKENNFDPLVAENWQLQSKEKLMTYKGARTVIFHHNNSLSAALSALFGFDKPKIPSNKPIWSARNYQRKIFEMYARDNLFDPLISHNWYSQKIARLLAYQGVRFVILYHKYSVSKALLALFPEIGLEKEKLRGFKPEWNVPENRRKFFETYAQLNKFDPLNPTMWYSQSSEQILSYKGARRAIFYHNNNLAQALIDLFPEIGLIERKLPSFKPEWHLPESRRRFFRNYAEDRGFKYSAPENWYSVSKDKLLLERGAQRVLSFHGSSVSRALIELFPDVKFNSSRFHDPNAKSVLHDAESRRRIFELYAKENKFDPLNPESWYQHAKARKILSFKGVLGAIKYHQLSVPKALMDLFPDVNFNKSKL